MLPSLWGWDGLGLGLGLGLGWGAFASMRKRASSMDEARRSCAVAFARRSERPSDIGITSQSNCSKQPHNHIPLLSVVALDRITHCGPVESHGESMRIHCDLHAQRIRERQVRQAALQCGTVA